MSASGVAGGYATGHDLDGLALPVGLLIVRDTRARDRRVTYMRPEPRFRCLIRSRPLLVGVERFGPIGVVDLADRAGRDYTTVSRQVAKLESLGLIERQASATDRRVSPAVVTPMGKTMTDAVDAARERLGRAVFASWDARDIDELVPLMRKFADAIQDEPPSGA
jgi:DNA-binding MarR family transcriptional regulator